MREIGVTYCVPYTLSRVPPPYVRPAYGSPAGIVATFVVPVPYDIASARPCVGPLTGTDASRSVFELELELVFEAFF